MKEKEISTSEAKVVLQKLAHERKAMEKAHDIISKLDKAEQDEREAIARTEAQKKLADKYDNKVLEANQIIKDAQEKSAGIIKDAEAEATQIVAEPKNNLAALQAKAEQDLAYAQANAASEQLKLQGLQETISHKNQVLADLDAKIKKHEATVQSIFGTVVK